MWHLVHTTSSGYTTRNPVPVCNRDSQDSGMVLALVERWGDGLVFMMLIDIAGSIHTGQLSDPA